ncbi:IS30 family transposase [Breznakia sp. PF5-3]|uniref:hypothetical protein n=1 Tax=unclassified Breznakia TaxID=2623764 RepID=UPI0024062A7C|nr:MULTISPECIES: hypothetical protein [unclassified Breznakia]MDF9825242.1 IS30 family transposase [Breznakia sp. PM6-1]MDF9836116.1 IS30 family transposase [Breznakia sp. PF5-3]MDF9838395.1 IS30 family transposase [Breznakia sp. PFB2-8]MDF9860411.1 IS30 family transposase [Breznakia sp. PH5-24]
MQHRIKQAYKQNQYYHSKDHQSRLNCPFTEKFPYTCNNCEKYPRCTKTRFKYDAYSANEIARKELKNSRSKPSLSNADIKKLDKKISPRVLQGQSLYHILQSDKTILKSESTIRRYIDQTLLTCRNIDLPRSCKSVNSCIRNLIQKLQQLYHRIFFDCILTDNGSEFKNLHNEEQDLETGEQFFKLFFCDPYSSFQKGGCERNHELFRYIHKKKENLRQSNSRRYI